MSLIFESDKFFWHDFIRFYEPFFQNKSIQNIAEIGIFKGNSVKWLLDRFPHASIFGVDILPLQDSWPVDSRFTFERFDQGDREKLSLFFNQRKFDLVIEDGSHLPKHQAIALLEGIPSLNSNGIYILEDVHTSYYRYSSRKIFNIELIKKQRGNALTVLLALKHYKELGINIDNKIALIIAKDSLFTSDEILMLNDSIRSIFLHKRTKLPDYCYSCGSVEFDFSSLRCRCGIDVFSDSDSMSFVIIRN